MPFDSTTTSPEIEPEIEEDETTRILREARNIIERGWCRETFARDKNGFGVDILSDDATNFCALGALERAAHVNGLVNGLDKLFEDDRVLEAFSALNDVPFVGSIIGYNDTHTQQEVLAAFDMAISKRTKANAL